MAILSLGGDVGKESVVVAACAATTTSVLGTFATTPADLAPLADAVTALQAQVGSSGVRLVLEPTGGYELGLAAWALAQGWEVWRPNPAAVRAWATGQGYRAKSDAADARMLAHYGAAGRPRPFRPLPAAVKELARLLDRQAELAQLQQQEANRHAALMRDGAIPAAVLASLDTLAQSLAAAQQALAEAISAHLAAHPDLAQTAARLRTIPGVGPKTVLWLLVLLARWDTLTEGAGSSKGLTALVGLDPVAHESGSSVWRPAHISKQGNRDLRRRLYLAALGGVRGHNPLAAFYASLVGRGKPKKLALVACARKLLCWAWAVYRCQQDFDPAKARPRTQEACTA